MSGGLQAVQFIRDLMCETLTQESYHLTNSDYEKDNQSLMTVGFSE